MQCGMCKYLSNISWGHVCYFLEDVLAVGPTYNKYMGTICVLWIMFYKCKLRNSNSRRQLHYTIPTFTVETLFSCFFLLLHKMQ